MAEVNIVKKAYYEKAGNENAKKAEGGMFLTDKVKYLDFAAEDYALAGMANEAYECIIKAEKALEAMCPGNDLGSIRQEHFGKICGKVEELLKKGFEEEKGINNLYNPKAGREGVIAPLAGILCLFLGVLLFSSNPTGFTIASFTENRISLLGIGLFVIGILGLWFYAKRNRLS